MKLELEKVDTPIDGEIYLIKWSKGWTTSVVESRTTWCETVYYFYASPFFWDWTEDEITSEEDAEFYALP